MKAKEFNTELKNKTPKVIEVLPAEKNKYLPHKNAGEGLDGKNDFVFSIKPYCLFLQCVGLQKVKFDRSKISLAGTVSKFYSAFVLAIILGGQIYVMTMRCLYFYKNNEPIDLVTDLLNLVPSTIGATVSLLMTISCNRRMILRTLTNFQIVDEQLNMQHTIKINKRIRKQVISFIIFMVTLTCLMYFLDYVVWDGPLRISVMVFVSTIKEMSLIELSLLTYIISTRVNEMNNQLEAKKFEMPSIIETEINMMYNKSETILKRIPHQGGYHDNLPSDDVELVRLMSIYDRLGDNANIINSCFGIPILCAAITLFINTISTIKVCMVISINTSELRFLMYINTVMWCVRDLAMVVLVTVTSELLNKSVRKTQRIINRLSISSQIDEVREEMLERFSHLRSCRSFTITAAGFFHYDFTFLYSLVGAIATYTVILLQVESGTKPKS